MGVCVGCAQQQRWLFGSLLCCFSTLGLCSLSLPASLLSLLSVCSLFSPFVLSPLCLFFSLHRSPPPYCPPPPPATLPNKHSVLHCTQPASYSGTMSGIYKHPPAKAAKGSILDLLASSPPSSPISDSQSPYSSSILIPPLRLIKPAPRKPTPHTEPGHSHRQRSKSPGLKVISLSRMNNRQAQPESSAVGAASAFKWTDPNFGLAYNDTSILDLTMDDYPEVRFHPT